MLGVVAGIEAVEPTGRGSVVAFRDEERGCAGSRALVASGRLPRRYVELHIEQGSVLLASDLPLAVVTGIAGVARGEIVTHGHAGHAGTTPMTGRTDALVAAAELILHVCDAAAEIEDAVATVGRIEVEPGAVNVIPERVVVSIDARAPDAERFEQLIDAIGLEPTYRVEPVAMSAAVRDALRAAIEARGLPVARARLRRRPRRRDSRGRGRRERDALRPEPERGRLAPSGRADERRGRRARRRRARRRVRLAQPVFAPAAIHAPTARSAAVMWVAFPSGIVVESTASALICAARAATSCGVSNAMPYRRGGELLATCGCCEWQYAQRCWTIGRDLGEGHRRARPPASRRGGARSRSGPARPPRRPGSTIACVPRAGC